MKYRMYFFVPYNISPIQQAIQAGHAALEYAHSYKDDPEFISFIENDKTWIILNGGTTNGKIREGLISVRDEEDPYRGSLDNLYVNLILWNLHNKEQNINTSIFQEPDLNDALTAVCFLADERVWDYENYPDYVDWFINSLGYISPQRTVEIKMLKYEDLMKNPKYPEWVEFIGGEKNVFLRNLLKGKKLAGAEPEVHISSSGPKWNGNKIIK